VALADLIAVAIAIALLILNNQFAALAFDASSAPTLGVNAGLVSAAALALLAVSVSVASNVAGTLLALALVTGPALGASAITHRLRSSLLVATTAGSLSGIAGLYLSYYADWPASASIAIVICAWAALASAAGGLPARAVPSGLRTGG
jgi:ABC-type Mn2+/Zn2+ transport system permease subunit